MHVKLLLERRFFLHILPKYLIYNYKIFNLFKIIFELFIYELKL